jgi:hypothetical protein
MQGRQKHAERQRRYRQRQKNKVTDHGSNDLSTNDVLPRKPNECKEQLKRSIQCHFCKKEVSAVLRYGFLSDHLLSRYSSWPLRTQ